MAERGLGTPGGDAVTDPERAAPPKPEAGGPADTIRNEAAAPPEDAGRSDTTLQPPEPVTETGGAAEQAIERREGNRVFHFLRSSWAELQRVQWPDRAALTSLTGVVLGFVLIAGGYLGLLDAIISRLIQAIL